MLPDAVAKAIGSVLADLHLEWKKDLSRIEAEARAVIAELKATNADLGGQIRSLQEQLAARVTDAIANIKDGAPGKEGEPGPQGAPGEHGDKGDAGERGDKGEAGDKGEPGSQGERGESGADGGKGEPGSPGEPGERGEPGQGGIAGKDGASVIGAVIDRDDKLIVTLADGVSRDLGIVVGRDGAVGLDGKNGTDGRDGFGFDDLSLHVDERGAFLVFERGEEKKEFRLPALIYRGVFKDGTPYEPGDCTTFGGSLWIARAATVEKPGTGKEWTLSVKHGRDGKDGVMKSAPEQKPVKIAM